MISIVSPTAGKRMSAITDDELERLKLAVTVEPRLSTR
jgi:hypothetical protein